jgi:hypothetical protein
VFRQQWLILLLISRCCSTVLSIYRRFQLRAYGVAIVDIAQRLRSVIAARRANAPLPDVPASRSSSVRSKHEFG